MSRDMAERLDPLFPNAGGLEHLKEVRLRWGTSLSDSSQRAGNTMFHPEEVEHLNKALDALQDDEVARSTLLSILAFAQMKSDVAGW